MKFKVYNCMYEDPYTPIFVEINNPKDFACEIVQFNKNKTHYYLINMESLEKFHNNKLKRWIPKVDYFHLVDPVEDLSIFAKILK